jgi:hypothetical protein
MFHERVRELKPRSFYESMRIIIVIIIIIIIFNINAILLVPREVLYGIEQNMDNLVMN